MLLLLIITITLSVSVQGTTYCCLYNQKFSRIIMGNCCISKSRDDDEDSYRHKVNFASGNVHLITTQERWEEKLAEAKRDSKIIVANFSASWCGPCRMLAPLFGELSEKYPTLMFLTVDVDDLPELSSSLDIRATPTFFFLKDGQQIDKLVGANKLELLKKIPAALDSAKQS
ncbi:hypothetical protein MKW92_047314 [Papaver armeniacum]|nr:hypothetical protein MKW92_047314 [Papaver armeniacum]